MKLEITVNAPGGVSIIFGGDASWTLRDVKQKVEAEKGIPANVQTISAGTQRLRDADLLSSITTLKAYDSHLSLTMRKRNAEQLHWIKLIEDGCGPAKIEQAPDVIRSDYDLMLIAAGSDADSLKHAHQNLLSSSDFILAAAKRNSDALNWAAKEMWSQRDFVLETLQYSWQWLKQATDELKSDRDFIMKATAQNSWALQCASENLRTDEQFVAMCKEGGRRDYIMDQMKGDGRSLCRARELRQDADVVKAAVNSQGTALQYASADLQADRSIVLQAINNDPMALQYAAKELRNDRDLVSAALEKAERAAEFASTELLSDKAMRDKVCGYTSGAKRPPVPPSGSSRPAVSRALAQANVTEITGLKNKSTRTVSAQRRSSSRSNTPQPRSRAASPSQPRSRAASPVNR